MLSRLLAPALASLAVFGVILLLAHSALDDATTAGAALDRKLDLRAIAASIEAAVDCNAALPCEPGNVVELKRKDGTVIPTRLGVFTLEARCAAADAIEVRATTVGPDTPASTAERMAFAHNAAALCQRPRKKVKTGACAWVVQTTDDRCTCDSLDAASGPSHVLVGTDANKPAPAGKLFQASCYCCQLLSYWE
jgi:hypothetical protein